MLSLRNLKKTYKSKGGNITKALDDVSVEFGENGLVFLLGKSGSGKSTLLNIAGGLDRPDEGEIIVKGKSSKDFSSSDFDSYRNTFIGFIFQEYNILDEFNVEENIALALQLQGKKSSKKEINALLEEVDLVGFNKRKPNTLSGGQKQRIAIARALIKNPEIIMADEPTGALDSKTGAQVFDTLKKLSKTKLVIVVSHDRDFAEIYGDRIIELKDGKIIEDVFKTESIKKEVNENINLISPTMVQIKDFSKVSEDDFKSIYNLLKQSNSEVIISSDQRNVNDIKKVCRVTENGGQEYFKNTTSDDIVYKEYDGKQTKFIKSTLPGSSALKMGASSLVSKKGRLFFTCLLSTIAFSLFGVVSTMMLYDSAYSVADAMNSDGNYQTLALTKEYKVKRTPIRENLKTFEKTYDTPYEYYDNIMFDDASIEELNNNDVGLKFTGVYGMPKHHYSDDLSIKLTSSFSSYEQNDYYNATNIEKYAVYDSSFFNDSNNFFIYGSYPTKEGEVAISNYHYEMFKEFNHKNNKGVTTQINDKSDLIGKSIYYKVIERTIFGYTEIEKELKIVGVFDSNHNFSSFNVLKDKNNSSINPEELSKMKRKFNDVLNNSFESVAIVHKSFIDENANAFSTNDESTYPSNTINREFNYWYSYNENYKLNYTNWYHVFTEETIKNNDNYSFFSIEGDKQASPDLNNKVYVPLYDLSDWGSAYLINAPYTIYFDENGNETFEEPDYSNCEKYYLVNTGSNNQEKLELLPKDVIAEHDEYRPVNFFYDNEGNVYVYNDHGEWRYYKNEDFTGNYLTYYDESRGYIYSTWHYERFILNPFNNTEYPATDKPHVYFNDAGDEYSFTQTNKFSNSAYQWYVVDGKVFNSKYVEDHPDEFDLNNIYQKSSQTIFVNKQTGEFSLIRKDNSIPLYRNNLVTFKKDNEIKIANQTWYGNEYGCTYYKNKLTNQFDKKASFTDFYKSATFQDINPEMYEFFLTIRSDIKDLSDMKESDIKQALNTLKNDGFRMVQTDEMFKLEKEKYKTPTLFLINNDGVEKEYEIGGFFYLKGSYINNSILISEKAINEFTVSTKDYDEYWWYDETTSDYNLTGNEKYAYAMTNTNNSMEQYSYLLNDNGLYRYYLENNIYTEIFTFTSMVNGFSMWFLIAGSVLAVFSALMLLNYISTSIVSKKKEIGVLRAIGARGSDVFKIFFTESGIIAAICIALATIASIIACNTINNYMVDSAINMKLLDFTLINALLITAVGIVVALIGTFFPVFKESKKAPVEAIRSL